METKCQQNVENDLEIIIARSVEEIESIRPVWEQMQADEPYPIINADIDRCLSVLQATGNECSPLVLLLKQNDRPRAAVIGRLERHAIPISVGYKAILKPKLRCMTVIYGGILGQPDEDVASLLIRELMKLLEQREADIIFFNHLRIDSVFFRQVRRNAYLAFHKAPIIYWTFDSGDTWSSDKRTVWKISGSAMTNGGAVVLIHDFDRKDQRTVKMVLESVSSALSCAKEKGLKVTTISQLLKAGR